MNAAINDILLSENARFVMEACYIPGITVINNFILEILGASNQDKALDTKTFNGVFPVIVAFEGTDQRMSNCSEFL